MNDKRNPGSVEMVTDSLGSQISVVGSDSLGSQISIQALAPPDPVGARNQNSADNASKQEGQEGGAGSDLACQLGAPNHSATTAARCRARDRS